MSEINRIVKSLTDLQQGDCWLGINFKAALHGVDAAMAANNMHSKTNSIWQLVSPIFTVVHWR